MTDTVDLYNTAYGEFEASAHELVRLETYGEDLGQSGWMNADELRQFIAWLGIDAGSDVLEVGSGSGGPALFVAEQTGARITGVDINEHGIAAANKMAGDRGLDGHAHFLQLDASLPLPFDDETFDAIICVDAFLHIPGRATVLGDWLRVLKPGGRALFTDPVVVTGLVTKEELAIRSSIGYFLFSPPGENDRLLTEAGFEIVRREDLSESTARVAKNWHDARAGHREALIDLEGNETYEGLQHFLNTTSNLAAERRLSRHVFVVRKPA